MITKMKSNYEFTLLAVHWCIFGFIGLDRLLLAYLIPVIMTDVNLSFSQAGFLVSVVGFTWGAMALIGGGLSTRFGRKKLIVPGTLVFSLMSWVTGLASTFTQFAVIRAILGLGEGAYYSSAVATISEEATPSRRGLLIGIHQSSFAVIGMVIAPIYALKITGALNWHWAFYLTLFPGIILAFLHRQLIREPASTAEIIEARKKGLEHAVLDENGEKVKWYGFLKYRNVMIAAITSICLAGWLYTFTAFAMSFLNTVRGIDLGITGYVMAIYGIGAAIGEIMGGVISDHLGRKTTFVLASIICGLSTVGFAFAPADLTILSIIIFIMGVSGFALFCIATGVMPSESVPFALSAGSVGFALAVGEILGSGLMPIIGGIMADTRGLQAPIILSGVIYLVPAVAGFFIKETAPRIVSLKKSQNIPNAEF